MNLIEFNKILSNPGNIKKDQIEGLHNIMEEYPYFQVAHFLHLNGLKKQRSFKYNDFLKKTAAYTTDRTVLFDHISADDIDLHPAPAPAPEEQIQQKIEEIVAVEEIKEAQEVVEIEPSPEEILKIGQPLQFKKDESYSFREWLQLSCFEPIDRHEASVAENQREKTASSMAQKEPQNMDLIDRFIASSPKINPSIYDNYADVATDSVQENENLMTETLAHVYVEQKKYKKAITAFTILSLKYPEKSSFFALQIEAIKKLQEK